jgi:hypothetical protein
MKLPLWRLIAAILVLLGMAGVLLALAPAYVEDYKLGQFIRSLARSPATPDEALRAAVIARARDLNLPLEPGDIRITHDNGKLQLQLKYSVQVDYALYQVKVHFHPSATSQ